MVELCLQVITIALELNPLHHGASGGLGQRIAMGGEHQARFDLAAVAHPELGQARPGPYRCILSMRVRRIFTEAD